MQSPKRTFPSDASLASARMNKREATVLAENAVQCQTFLYDFSQDGGAVGDVSFGVKLPANAVVTSIYSDEQTAFTSGGSATITLKAGSTSLTGALAFNTDFTGQDKQDLASSADAIKLSSASELKLTIGTAALTAGKCRFAIYFHQSK
jgi:hypothetical protein